MKRITHFFTASIRRKILSSFSIVIVLVLAMVIGGFYQLNQVRSASEQVMPNSSQMGALQEFALSISSLDANLERFFVIGGAQFQEDIFQDLEDMAAALETIQDKASEDARPAIAELEQTTKELENEIGFLLESRSGDLSSRETNERIISIYSQIDSIKQLNQGLSAATVNQLQATAFQQESITSNVIIQFLVLGALVSLIVVIASLVVTRTIATPLAGLAETATQIAEGDLDAEAPIITQDDEVGQLATAFNSMTDQLQGLIGSLEEQVQARTAELALSMEVGQQASAIRDVDELVPTITEFIREQFDLYYTHVYFVDEVGQNLIIKAGTGEVGEQLLTRRHSLPVGAGSIVGQVAATARSIVVSDTETSDIHRPNLLLPDTRSELAVPLIVEGRVTGVLDMQSDRMGTFTEENLTVFEAMATQLAISIDSAQQWAGSQAAQRRSEEALSQLIRESWAEKLARERTELGFTYDLSAVMPISQPERATEPNGLSVPLVVQNQPIGHLSVGPLPDRDWSEDEQDLLAAVAEQLAQKAENLRLFEQTQQAGGPGAGRPPDCRQGAGQPGH